MSAAAALVCVSPPRPATIINSRPSSPTPRCRRASSSSITNNFFFISSRSSLHGISGGTYTLWPSYLSRRRFHLGITRRFSSPVMEWQDCTVKMDIDVPISVAYKCYSDREAIPHWMPFISSVKILENKPDTSQWSLKYTAFGRDIEFSWLARNMQPIPNQKIHWRSLEGLPNRGAARFFPRGASSCIVELTVSYEVPQLLVPVASALKPFLENLLTQGLERFAKFAKNYAADSSTRSKQGD